MSQKIIKKLESIGLGRLRISMRGTPHLVCQGPEFDYSVVYFGRGNFYRVFYPWPTFEGEQKKFNFAKPADVKIFLESKGVTK